MKGTRDTVAALAELSVTLLKAGDEITEKERESLVCLALSEIIEKPVDVQEKPGKRMVANAASV